MGEITRASQKKRSHRRIVDEASRRFREEGLKGAAVQEIMEGAGLTHGGFYSHFDSKDDLMVEAISEAARMQMGVWLEGIEESPEAERFALLVARYLSRAHRDAPGAGCPLPSLSAEVSRAAPAVRGAYEDGLRAVLSGLETKFADKEDGEARSRAMGALALCVGGMMLARAVEDTAFSDEILQLCRQFAAEQDQGE